MKLLVTVTMKLLVTVTMKLLVTVTMKLLVTVTMKLSGGGTYGTPMPAECGPPSVCLYLADKLLESSKTWVY